MLTVCPVCTSSKSQLRWHVVPFCYLAACFTLQPTPKGGGVVIEAPLEDRADGSSDRGFLEQVNITIVNTLIEGNVAQEGAGVWSAWPMAIRNTTIRRNTAERAVSNRARCAAVGDGSHAGMCAAECLQVPVEGSLAERVQQSRASPCCDMLCCVVLACRVVASFCVGCSRTK